ncbi:hypothetical protein SLEP1_g48154 [Rubroshorea leprosula]|uniref:Uncharacterized protein n=1 Tax=Rubroshorea leprosula TaxID=152421 RepID=A0AAV5LSQ6_9ROSI|nr:hypothetical protein SLEP1_g48154 [Rubroshorea leprosula]
MDQKGGPGTQIRSCIMLVPVLVDDTGCTGNKDINFRCTGFTISGRVVGSVGWGAAYLKMEYKLHASHPDIKIEVRGSTEYGNTLDVGGIGISKWCI